MARINPLPPVFLVLVALFLNSCSGLVPSIDPAVEKKAAAAAARVRSANREIATSKGTGWLTLNTGARSEQFKIAWAAAAPNRLRLTLMAYGQPVETIAASGERVTFISHTGRHKPHTTASADPDLERYIDIPVKLSELIAILLGQTPVRPFDRAWLAPDSPDTVVTTQGFSDVLQHLSLDPEGRVRRYWLTRNGGNLVYSMAYTAFKTSNGISTPSGLTLSDGNGRTLRLELTRLIPNADVKESVFRLTPSGS